MSHTGRCLLSVKECEQNVGLNEVYQPADAPICCKLRPCFVQRALMEALIDEGLLVKSFMESFGDGLKRTYEVGLSAVLKREELTWQALMSQLVQEYSSQNVTKSRSFPCEEGA